MSFLKVKLLNKVKQSIAFTFLYISIALTLLVLAFILFYIFINGLYTVNEKEESYLYLDQTSINWQGREYGLWVNKAIKRNNLSYGELQTIFTSSTRNWAYLSEQRYPLLPILIGSQQQEKASWLDFLSPQQDLDYQSRVQFSPELGKALERMQKDKGALLVLCLDTLNEGELSQLRNNRNIKPLSYRPYVLAVNISDEENDNEWHLTKNQWEELKKKGELVFQKKEIKVNKNIKNVIDDSFHIEPCQVALIENQAKLSEANFNHCKNEVRIVTGRFAKKTDRTYLFWKEQTRNFSLTWDYFTTPPFEGSKFGGISFIITNTLFMILGTSILAIPLGVCSALYLVHYSRQGSRLSSLIRTAFDILSSLPAIIFGLFGMTIFVPIFGLGLISGCFSTTLMILPNITKVSEVSLKSVPKEIYHASLALGATKFTSLFKVVLPCAAPGIITGIILAIGRAFSEAAVLLFTLGTSLTPIENWHTSGRVLTVHLYLILQEGGVSRAFPIALVIVFTVLVLNIIADSIRDRFGRQMKNN